MKIAVNVNQPLKGKRIALDPGHGGEETGARGPGGTLEKDVNLAIGKKLKEILTERGAEVVMTREEDKTVPLEERPKILDAHPCDLFVSNHVNAMPDEERASSCGIDPAKNAQGTETYWNRDGSEKDKKLAQAVHVNLVKALKRPDRGLRQAGFLVLREADKRGVPATLAEILFIDNAEEEVLLKDPAVQEAAAKAVADGIEEFFRESTPP